MQPFPWRMILVTVLLSGCTGMCSTSRKDMTPEQVVEAYLDTALNMTEVNQRQLLAEYTTGNLKSALDSATPEQIRQAYVDRRYEIRTYSVVERRDRTPRETEITFQLTYKDLGIDPKTVAAEEAATVTTENTVSVVKEDGLWLVRDVMGNKTSIDFPVSEDSRITASPGGK